MRYFPVRKETILKKMARPQMTAGPGTILHRSVVGLRKSTQYHRHGFGSRTHDLQHTFAVHTTLDWFREGTDIDREKYRLSIYLGHTKPEHTYLYIEAVPELLELYRRKRTAGTRWATSIWPWRFGQQGKAKRVGDTICFDDLGVRRRPPPLR